MKKLFLLLIAICAISLGMSAQQVVRGQVTDPNGEPLIGATVQPVGGGNGAATDVNGEFSLNLPYNVKTLKVSYVGYKTQELPVQPNMAITMSDNGTALDEVMVVAYGTAKKTSYTGSAEAVTNKKLDPVRLPASRFVVMVLSTPPASRCMLSMVPPSMVA